MTAARDQGASTRGRSLGLAEMLRSDRWVGVLAAATTVFHLVTYRGYGIFRDELYYLATARHLAWGYVDQPPLEALVAWVVTHTLGTSLFAVRLVPALAAGALVALGGAIARQLGGGRFAQLLTGAAVALAPQYVGMLSIYSMNALDLLFWSALVLVFIRILRTGDGRLWLLFGALAGLGLQNKLSVLFLCCGVAAGLLLGGQWRQLRDVRLWLGVGLAAVIFAPHVLWQMANGWPTAEFVRRATENKNVAYAPVAFIVEQMMMMNPLTAPLWLAGLAALFAAKDLRQYRALGWAYLAVLALMLTQASKPYYLSPIYPLLYAAGAVTLERAAASRRWGWLRPAALTVVVLSGALLVPLAKPLLPEDTYVAYAAALGVAPGTDERHELGRLPQFYADMHGWRELAEAVGQVYRSLPAEERAQACVFGQNYGEAGAIEYFGRSMELPPAISGHNSYWLWGPGDCTGQVMIVIGGDKEDLVRGFDEVEEGGQFHCSDCMPYEDDQILWIARGLHEPIADVWPRVKHFD